MESEGIETEDRALKFIARAADGSMRDAQSLLDQCIAFYIGQKLTYEKVVEVLGSVETEVFARLLRYINDGQVPGCMSVLDEVLSTGGELVQFVTDFAGYLRNLLLAQSVDDPEEVLELSRENMELVIHESKQVNSETVVRYIGIMSELANRIRYASQKRLLIEVELIKMARPQMQPDYESLLDRIRILENQMSNGVIVQRNNVQDVTGVSDISEDNGPDAVNEEELAKALPEDIRQIAGNWANIISKMSQTDKLASAVLSDAIPLEEEGKLVIKLKSNLDVLAMQFKGEANGESLPSRIDILQRVISSVTGKKVEIRAEIDDGSVISKKKDIRKLVKFDIKKVD